jgi:hypothetical protein
MKKLLVAFLVLYVPLLATGQQPDATNRPTGNTQTAASLSYNQLVATGFDLLKEARVGEAYLAAMEAAKKNPGRFEAYALAGLALHVRGNDREAKPLVDKALALAPAASKRLLNELASKIKNGLAPASKSDPEMRRKLDVLRLILEDADNAQGDARHNLLLEFLDKTEPLITQYPDDAQIWILRAAASIECGYCPSTGREAAFQLMRLGQDKSDNKAVQRLIATMDRNGWIYPMNLELQPLLAEFNGLLKQLGTVSGSTYEKDATASEYTKREISYGELQGTCDSGFYFQINENGKRNFFPTSHDPSEKDTWTQSGIYYFDVADAKFFADWRQFEVGSEFLYRWWAEPHAIRDKKRHYSTTYSGGTPTANDSEPDDLSFTLAANLHPDKLVEDLNKIHWACLCQQAHTH